MSSWVRTGAIAVMITSVLSSRAIAAQTSTTELPIVRSAILQPALRVPWSQPVKVIDPFEGESLAVFDQNYFFRSFSNNSSQVEVVSLWKPDSVRVLLAYSSRKCTIARHSFSLHHRFSTSRRGYYPFGYFNDGFSDSVCVINNDTQKITGLSIKIGDRVFQLENKNGQFPVNSELATALKNAPEQNAQLRAIADNGEVIDSAIGKGTVRAWRSIY